MGLVFFVWLALAAAAFGLISRFGACAWKTFGSVNKNDTWQGGLRRNASSSEAFLFYTPLSLNALCLFQAPGLEPHPCVPAHGKRVGVLIKTILRKVVGDVMFRTPKRIFSHPSESERVVLISGLRAQNHTRVFSRMENVWECQ